MADYLSAALRGLESGARTGLDIYRTLEGEKRAKRQEELQAQRYAAEDARWERQWNRQVERDAVGDDQWEQTFKFNEDKLLAQQKLDAEKFAWQRAKDTDASKARWAGVNERRRGNDLAERREQRATLKELTEQAGAAFADPQGGGQAFTELMNNSPRHRLAVVTQAQRLGLIDEMPPELVGRMTLLPGEGGYAIGMVGDDGKTVTAYDPDGDGQAAFVPAPVLARVLGGQSAANGVHADQAMADAGAAVLSSASSRVSAAAEQAVAMADAGRGDVAAGDARFAEIGTRLQELAANKPLTLSGRVAWDRETAALRQEAVDLGNKRASALSEVAQAPGMVDAAQARGNAEIKAAAPALNTLSELPVEKRPQAMRSFQETYARDPQLANAYPGLNYADATQAFNKERGALIDDLVGGADFKTGKDAKGKPTAATGVESRTRATLEALSPELLVALRDHTGQARSALRLSVQQAVESGDSAMVPYLLRAAGSGSDPEFVAQAMKSPALLKVKDPERRYALASKADELRQADPVRAERVGLEGLLMEAQGALGPKSLSQTK